MNELEQLASVQEQPYNASPAMSPSRRSNRPSSGSSSGASFQRIYWAVLLAMLTAQVITFAVRSLTEMNSERGARNASERLNNR